MKKKTVLVVEDELDMRIFLSTLLETGGYQAILTRDGKEGMLRAKDACPDLILGKEILRGKKKVAYGHTHEENAVHADDFNCLAPIYYFERSRQNCGGCAT